MLILLFTFFKSLCEQVKLVSFKIKRNCYNDTWSQQCFHYPDYYCSVELSEILPHVQLIIIEPYQVNNHVIGTNNNMKKMVIFLNNEYF